MNSIQILLFILIGVFSRIAPHPANMTAIGAVSLFSGLRIKGKSAFFVPLVTMFLSDMVLGFHSVMWATYSSLLVAVALGRWIKNHQSISWIFGATLFSSLSFFFLTNFAVWFEGFLYPKTFSGFVECFIMALPFFRNSLAGDAGYSIVFGLAHEVIKRFTFSLKEKNYARSFSS